MNNLRALRGFLGFLIEQPNAIHTLNYFDNLQYNYLSPHLDNLRVPRAGQDICSRGGNSHGSRTAATQNSMEPVHWHGTVEGVANDFECIVGAGMD